MAAKKSAKKAAKKAPQKLSKGDHVEWGTSQGKTQGKVVGKVTGEKSVKGHTAKASAEDPQYEVKTDKSRKNAIHKPEELKKIK